MRLSVKAARASEPGSDTRIVWDDDLPGFGLRVTPTRRKTWIVQCRIGQGRAAKQRKITLGDINVMTADEARKEARAALYKAAKGEDPRPAPEVSEAAMTLSDFLDRWEVEAAPFRRKGGARRKPEVVEDDIRRVAMYVRPIVGGVPLEEFGKKHIAQLRAAVAAGKGKALSARGRGRSRTIGGDGAAFAVLRVLRSALSYAVEIDLLERHPFTGYTIPQTNARERFLSSEELRRLGEALEAEDVHPYARSIIRLLVFTGARRTEIAALRWREVDLERGFLFKLETKTGKQAIPIGKAAIKLLSELPRDHPEWVFPASRGEGYYAGLNKQWERIREAAGLDGVRLHDLRHTFASAGAAGGLGLTVVGALLGQSQTATTARYSHLAESPMRAAADLISDSLAEKLGGAA